MEHSDLEELLRSKSFTLDELDKICPIYIRGLGGSVILMHGKHRYIMMYDKNSGEYEFMDSYEDDTRVKKI